MFFFFFLRSSILELKIEHLNLNQVNHHGKTITVGGERDSDKDPLVERVAMHIDIQNIQYVQIFKIFKMFKMFKILTRTLLWTG